MVGAFRENLRYTPSLGGLYEVMNSFRRHLNVIEDLTEMPSVLSRWPPSRFPDNDFRFLENRDFESYLYLYIVAASNLDQELYGPLGAKMDSIADLIRAGLEE